jgi:hypothetical protein
MAITPQNPGAIDTPNTLTPDGAGSVAVPNTLAPEAAGSVSVPTALAAGGINPNIFLYSEQFDNAAWSKFGVNGGSGPVVEANQTVAPDGSLTADKVTFATGGGSGRSVMRQSISLTVDGTQSYWIKSAGAGSNIGITTGGVTKVVTITQDWQRVSDDILSSVAYGGLEASSLTDSDVEIYVWGAQLEESSAPTAYAPTEGVSRKAGELSIPNTLTAESAGAVAVPSTLTAQAAVAPAVPNTLTGTDQPAFPRTLTPTVDLNYGAGLFAQNGSAVAESDLITYARASSATYIDRYKKGNKWEYYLNTDYVGSVTNLIGYSEDLSQGGWTLSSATLQSVAVKSPAGTVGVKKLVGDGTSDYHALYKPSQTLAGNTYSVYLKYAGNRHVLLGSHYTSAPKNRGAFFDLLSGTIGQVGDGIAASILPVGDGWYRCSITGGDAPSTIFTVELSSDGDTLSYADDAESGVLVWGTQRTAGEKVLPYVKTLATSASETFTESPRVEYDAATGDCLGALIEQASTNLCLRSEEFDHASWAKSSATITANDTQAPDLTTSADKLQAGSTGTVGPLARQPVAVTATNIYTISAFVKRGEADFIQITFVTGEVINNPKVNFDLSLGVVGTQDADIGAATMTPVGNDWFRITATVEAALSLLTPRFVLIKSATDSRGLTNSWTAGEGLYIWGAQIEQTAIPTSYIPTTTAAVSRLADQVSIPVAGNVPSGDVSFRALFDFLGSLNSHIYRVKSTTDDFRLYKGGTDLFSKSGSRTQTLASNASGAFDVVSSFNRSSNTVECFVDGHSVISDDVGSAAMPNVSGVVGIGNVTPAAANQLNGHIKRFTIYDEALTADEVAQL